MSTIDFGSAAGLSPARNRRQGADVHHSVRSRFQSTSPSVSLCIASELGRPEANDRRLSSNRMPTTCREANTNAKQLIAELRRIGESEEHTTKIKDILLRKSLPVDVRHNVKINREQLAVWTARQAGGETTVTALVTGAAGFLGRYIVERLTARGEHVRAFCRTPAAEVSCNRSPILCKYKLGDVRDPKGLDDASKASIRCFMSPVSQRCGDRGRHFYENNVVGTRNVIAAVTVTECVG